MNVIYINISNFRNIINLEENFINGTNILYGNNAQGKTNLIESIYITSNIKSFRKTDDEKIINHNSEYYKILSKIDTGESEKDILVSYDRNTGKKIFLNNKPINRYSEYIGNIKVTMFSPEDLMIINGDSSYRRNFVDIIFCKSDNFYLNDLIKFYKILKQRNNALKLIRSGQKKSIIEPWNEQLEIYSEKIVTKRIKNILKINEKSHNYHTLLNNNEKLEIKYKSILCDKNEALFIEYCEKFRQYQKKIFAEEIQRGYTMLGPHRDDIDININSRNTRYFASQGQKKSVAISLRLSEADYFFSETQEYPILLVDDIFSELDDNRKEALMKVISNKHQIFITGTNLNDMKLLLDDAKIFLVENGKTLCK